MQKRENHPSSELPVSLPELFPSSEAIHSKIGELEKNKKQDEMMGGRGEGGGGSGLNSVMVWNRHHERTFP